MQIQPIKPIKFHQPHFNGAFIVEGTPDEIRKVDEKAIDEFYKEIETPLDRFSKNNNRKFKDFERINLIPQDNPISQRLYMTNEDAPFLRVYKDNYSLFKIFGLSVDQKAPAEIFAEEFFKQGNSDYYMNLILNKHITKNPEYIPDHFYNALSILKEIKALFLTNNKHLFTTEIPNIQAKEILNPGRGLLFDFAKGVFKIARK